MILVIRFIDVSIAQKARFFNLKMKIVHICVKIHFVSSVSPSSSAASSSATSSAQDTDQAQKGCCTKPSGFVQQPLS